MSEATEIYDKITSLLTPPSSSSRHRAPNELFVRLKRIRRVILDDGIPELVISLTRLRPRMKSH